MFLRSVEDIRRFWRKHDGVADTAAVYGWQLIRHHVPGIRSVVIRRPIEGVLDAFAALQDKGVGQWDPDRLRASLERGERALNEAAGYSLTVDFADLATEDTCRAIFEHCLPFAWDREGWERWKDVNVQSDVGATHLYYHENQATIDGFKLACKREMFRLRRAGLIRKVA